MFLSYTIGSIAIWEIPQVAVNFVSSGYISSLYDARYLNLAIYLNIMLAWIICCFLIIGKYKNWDGLISTREQNDIQHGRRTNFIVDAINYFADPVLFPYSEFGTISDIAASEALKDSTLQSGLAWKDQARILLRMLDRSYTFDSYEDEDWHENPGCWIGSHARTHETIVLYPISNLVNMSINTVTRYLERLSLDKKKTEIIIIGRDDTYETPENADGWNIKYLTEAHILNDVLDLSDYKRSISDLVEKEPITQGSQKTLRDVYVPPFFSTPDKSEHGDIEEYIMHWLYDSTPTLPSPVILGDYGQGKSAVALMLTYHLLCEKDIVPQRIPLLIELRNMSPSNNRGTQGLLGDWAAKHNLNPLVLDWLNDAGRLLIIFEGFDELSLVGDDEQRQRNFYALWSFKRPRSRIILTGRPNLFRGDDTMRKALGVSFVNSGLYSENKPLVLDYFTNEQVKNSLRSYPQKIIVEIVERFQNDRNFRELTARPSLLHIVAELWGDPKLVAMMSNLNSADILDLFVKRSFRRPGVKLGSVGEQVILTTNERLYFMCGIAAYMVMQRLPNRITDQQLSSAVELLIDALPVEVSTSSTADSGETAIPLLQRIRNKPYGRGNVKDDVRTCGLLVRDPASPETFRFAHKMFLEYLFAKNLGGFFRRDESLDKKQAIAIDAVIGLNYRAVLRPDMTAAILFFADVLMNEPSYIYTEAKSKEAQIAERLFRIAFNVTDIYDAKYIWQILLQHLILPTERRQKFIAALLANVQTSPRRQLFVLLFPVFMGLLITFCSTIPSIFGLSDLFLIYIIFQGISLIGTVIFLFGMFWMMIVVENHRENFNNLNRWTRLCKPHNISVKILHSVLGEFPLSRFFIEDGRLFGDYRSIPIARDEEE